MRSPCENPATGRPAIAVSLRSASGAWLRSPRVVSGIPRSFAKYSTFLARRETRVQPSKRIATSRTWIVFQSPSGDAIRHFGPAAGPRAHSRSNAKLSATTAPRIFAVERWVMRAPMLALGTV